MELRFTQQFLRELDKLAHTYSKSREHFLEIIKNALWQIEYADAETYEKILESGVFEADDFGINEITSPRNYRAGFSTTIRFEEITREDCLNFDEFFKHKLKICKEFEKLKTK